MGARSRLFGPLCDELVVAQESRVRTKSAVRLYRKRSKKMRSISGTRTREAPISDVTPEFVLGMIRLFRANKLLDVEHVVAILKRVKRVFTAEPNVVDATAHPRVTVVGDLHGQLADLLYILRRNGLPSERNAYLFNGDFVDRGQHSCECALIIFALKLLYPNHVHVNRGNHETRDANRRGGFKKECLRKYNERVFDLFSDVFAALPLAHIIHDKVFVVHGGLSWRDLTIDDVQRIDRFHHIPPDDSLQEQLLWGDPKDGKGRKASPRGASLLFGPDVTAHFLRTFLHNKKMKLIVRSHECVKQGYDLKHDGALITVFSATGYCRNDGAFLIFDRRARPRIVRYYRDGQRVVHRRATSAKA